MSNLSNRAGYHALPLCGEHLGVASRARAYMLANIDGRISVHELATRVGVSERTLRNVFRKAYGTSPSQYLKAIRLLQARHTLENADPRRTTVLCVALRSGFWHMSRFSADYKQRFGELPSATLKAPPRNSAA